jgi:hypothetical protein
MTDPGRPDRQREGTVAVPRPLPADPAEDKACSGDETEWAARVPDGGSPRAALSAITRHVDDYANRAAYPAPREA